MSASARFADIVRMLETCAPGHNIRRTTHGHRVAYNGKLFPDLTKHDNIELGHIRKMCRYFGILDCAKKHIQNL
jgi:hypothetical protein